MSRFTTRKRWLMAGPWPHPKTGILYYRKVTPPDLWEARKRLEAMNVKVTREVQRSLGTKDQRPAERRYLEVAREQEAIWAGWRDMLRNGPQSLSHKQRLGLAGDYARAFLARHEEEPFDAPLAPVPPVPDFGAALAMMDAAETRLGPAEWAALTADLEAFGRAEGVEQVKLAVQLIERYPEAFVADLAAGVEKMFGADTSAALASRGLNVEDDTRHGVNFAMAGLMTAARRGLEARQGGDYRPVPELQASPTFTVPTSAPATSPANALSLIELLDHKARTRSIRAKTVSDNKAYLRKFIAFVGFDDARRVEKRHVREWRDSLGAQTDPSLSPKTIRDRYISAVKSALSHGVAEFDLPFNAAAGITDSREAERKERKEWTDEEAKEILNATFTGSAKALSQPHKRALFWVPWILAYTGLRAGEVTQLQGRSLVTKDGVPHLIITPFDGSTKGGNAWATAIHQHLIDLGFLDFVREVGEGPLFYEPDNDGAELTPDERRSRVLESYKRVGDWVTDELGLTAPLGRPNHAWRHRFTTVSRKCGMDKEARDFMLGSRSRTDAREGYGDWPPTVLDREINKQPQLKVNDTGWRP